MTTRRGLLKMATLAVVLTLPLITLSAVASAKGAKAKTTACVKHPNRPRCATPGGGGTGGGTAGTPASIIVEVDPHPVVETGQSEVHVVIQVETDASFAGDAVNIDSSQLAASCREVDYESMQIGVGGIQFAPPKIFDYQNRVSAVLDDDGNATVEADGFDCAPGSDVIEADLEVAPFLTALTTLTVSAPAVTAEGVSGFPQIAGTAQEVETGDTSTSGDSDIYAVFYVETNPVYAEQQAEIGSAQLEGRCIEGWVWQAENETNLLAPDQTAAGVGVTTHTEVETTLDDDGNAVFVFEGASCASGPSEVIADVMAGSHPTYTTDFTVDPPVVTI